MSVEGKASTSKPAKLKPSNFCVQLHGLLENPRDPENLRWVDGQMDQFQITVNEQKALDALRPTLDFKSMSSFVRQLSYYDFKRLSDRRKSNERRGEARVIVFTHQSGLFMRGNPANVEKMKRKLRVRAERGRRASAVSTTSVDEDHSQSVSPLFSPTGSTWTTNEPPPPLPSPAFPAAFSSGMGSFSLSAPPPPRTMVGPASSVETQLPRWQPYNPPDSAHAYPPPSPASQSPSTYEAPRYSPYPRAPLAPLAPDRRASVASLASDLSPRSKSLELYYGGGPPRPSPGSFGPNESTEAPVTAFSNPFANPSFPSPSAQPSHYFPSSRHPASPGTDPFHPTAIPTGLAVAYDNPSAPSSSTSTLPVSPDSTYPHRPSHNHYRPTPPSGFNFLSPHERQQHDDGSIPLRFRNHQRFTSVPSQPPYPHPQFASSRPEDYHSPTSVPDDEFSRRAALEARRTSYPFPRPLPPSSHDSGAPAYSHPQTFDSPEPSASISRSDWSNSKPYYPHETVPLAEPVPSAMAGEDPIRWQQDGGGSHYTHSHGNSVKNVDRGTDSNFVEREQSYYGSFEGGGGGGGGGDNGIRASGGGGLFSHYGHPDQ